MKLFGKELIFNGNKVYHTGNKPTASEIGAAASSHTHNYAGSSSAGGAANSALTATKSTQDSAGQQINTTYIKGLSVSGRTITYTKGNGTTGTITTQDTNTTYSTGTSSSLGLTKLYTGTGTATDGTMTQAAINTALSGKAASSHTHNYAGSSSAGGAANSANTLTTARTINGTSFNGSANITTANWGTTRTLTIGNTGKSVNGSGNVSWSLSEIGAAPTSHTHSYLPLSGGTISGGLYDNRIGTGNKQLFNATAKNIIVGNPATPLYLESSEFPSLVVKSEYCNLLTTHKDQLVVKGQDKEVGDFADWNNFEYSGIYLVSINDNNWGSNCPPSSYPWGNLLVFRNSFDTVTQIYFPHSSAHSFQFRTRWGNSQNWTNWINLAWWGKSQTLELTEEGEENNISVEYIMQQLEEQKKINEELHKKINILEDKISKI